LTKLYPNLAAIGNFVGDNYWSSSEYSPQDGWLLPRGTGNFHWEAKWHDWFNVRCVRAF
jgi:hypothetical protein